MTPAFSLTLPLDLAPTLNVWLRTHYRVQRKILDAIGVRILEAKTRCRGWDHGVQRLPSKVKGRPGKAISGLVRRVRVTRWSTTQPDDLGADALGAKAVLDALVAANVLRDDSPAWCRREAGWVKAKRGEGRLVVEVFAVEEAS